MKFSYVKGRYRRQAKFVTFVFSLSLSIIFSASQPVYALERLHILIPGGAGGGWDTTARGVGEALTRSGLVPRASYENKSGGDGSKAIAYLIETAERQTDTLMISSTPIVLKSLKNIFPQSYKDLIPVAAVIADYGAFVVSTDSKYADWQQVIADFKLDPRNVLVAGGSVIGGMDHVVAAMAFDNRVLTPEPFVIFLTTLEPRRWSGCCLVRRNYCLQG